MDPAVLFRALPILDFISIVKPLVGFSIAMALYAIFVYKFYTFLSKRDVFEARKTNESFTDTILRYIVDYIVVLPLYTTFWFFMMATFVIFLSKRTTLAEILLISMTIIAAIRITAYYRQELSEDLAKLLPLFLLSTFILDVSAFSFHSSMNMIRSIPTEWRTIIAYVGIVIIMENVLRVGEYVIRNTKRRVMYSYEMQKKKVVV